MADVNEEDVLEVLKKDKKIIENYTKHEVLPLSDKPIGFLADHFILRVHFISSRTKDYFLKMVPTTIAKRAEYLVETGFFVREAQVYQELIPKLLKYSSLPWAPECYLARNENFIIMENLNNFKIYANEKLIFDLDHMKVASTALAVFHASSLILEAKTGRKISEKYSEMLTETAYPQTVGHVRQQGLENAIEVLSELVKLIPKYQNSAKLQEIVDKFPNAMRKIYKFAEASKKFKNVASHGDLWVNNIMFKYDREKPIACKFVDFQLARYTVPAFDLAQLIYINTAKDFRDLHLDDILNLYCDTLEKELKRAKLNPKILPRSEVFKSFKDYHLAGLIEAVLFGHLTLLPSTMSSNILSSSEEYDKFINQSRVKTCLKAFEEEYYRDRLTESLTEIIDKFVILGS